MSVVAVVVFHDDKVLLGLSVWRVFVDAEEQCSESVRRSKH